ncbi:MAG: hypothetical protein LBT44_07785 [Clostridiales bacterium]|jgi:hypothetical protein|nr:hypothetical protein [Clostridiales bacterium]
MMTIQKTARQQNTRKKIIVLIILLVMMGGGLLIARLTGLIGQSRVYRATFVGFNSALNLREMA